MGLYLLETTVVCNSVVQNKDWKCIPSYEYNFQSVDYTFNFLMIRNILFPKNGLINVIIQKLSAVLKYILNQLSLSGKLLILLIYELYIFILHIHGIQNVTTVDFIP